MVEAAEAARGAAVSVDGRMVDRPVIARAEAILSESSGAILVCTAMMRRRRFRDSARRAR